MYVNERDLGGIADLGELIGRKNKIKLIKKQKRYEAFESLKGVFYKVGVWVLLFLVFSMGTYILIDEIRDNNFIKRIDNDPYISESIEHKIKEYFYK